MLLELGMPNRFHINDPRYCQATSQRPSNWLKRCGKRQGIYGCSPKVFADIDILSRYRYIYMILHIHNHRYYINYIIYIHTWLDGNSTVNIICAWGIIRCHVRFPQGVDRVIDDSLLHITPHDQKPLLWCLNPEFLREVGLIFHPPILSTLQMGPNVCKSRTSTDRLLQISAA